MRCLDHPFAACRAIVASLSRTRAGATRSPTRAPRPRPAAQPGELRVTASEHGFTPASLAIPKGAAGSSLTVSFVRTTDQTCATEVVFPELDIKKPLPLNQVVAINVPSDAARTLTFQCGMGMYKGALLVK